MPSLYPPPGLPFPTAERSRTRPHRREANNLQALPQRKKKNSHTHTQMPPQVASHSISEPSEVTAGNNPDRRRTTDTNSSGLSSLKTYFTEDLSFLSGSTILK
ncbi:hypothetical protein ILYODFUR_024735 [Ilyodon furcidens]|uniref:Uncharacterized protein n=1 Tax=Ilyodon furcidens TaxID=33524 RepID=A0ABV0UKD1_9TELE